MKMLCFTLTLFIFWGCSRNKKEGNEEEATKSEVVKIMTYNIHHGVPIHQPTNDVQLSGIAAVIKKNQPDLVALQEVDSNTTRSPVDEAKKLGEMTGMNYFFAKTIDFQGGAYGIAILSRYPIKARKKYMLPMPDPSGEQRAVAITKVRITSGLEIYFASTHLDLKEDNRLAQVKRIIEISKELNAPFIIAGDLNATPHEQGIRKLQQEFVFSCVGNDCPLTFHSIKPTKTIDYILLNSKAATLLHSMSYSAIKGILASDHLPVLEYLTIQNK